MLSDVLEAILDGLRLRLLQLSSHVEPACTKMSHKKNRIAAQRGAIVELLDSMGVGICFLHAFQTVHRVSNFMLFLTCLSFFCHLSSFCRNCQISLLM